MTRTRLIGSLAGALGCLTFAGCIGADDGTAEDAIDTTPASLVEGRAELEKIDRIMAERGSTAALVEKERLIRDRMDTLSGLVDRIEVAPDHTLNFFVSRDGVTLVSERMKAGMPSAMAANSSEAIDSIYRRLAPGRSIPAALANAAAVETGDVATALGQQGGGLAAPTDAPATAVGPDGITAVRAALTDSAADDLWFRNNACPTGNVLSFCVVDWTGGRFAQETSDHSQVNAAFTRGTGSILLNYGPNGTTTFSFPVLPGEFHHFWVVGPKKSVPNAGCIPLIACQTHYEAQRFFHRWSITNATNKVFDFGGMFYNKPLAWNTR
jgi:hypothetical protein